MNNNRHKAIKVVIIPELKWEVENRSRVCLYQCESGGIAVSMLQKTKRAKEEDERDFATDFSISSQQVALLKCI